MVKLKDSSANTKQPPYSDTASTDSQCESEAPGESIMIVRFTRWNRWVNYDIIIIIIIIIIITITAAINQWQSLGYT